MEKEFTINEVKSLLSFFKRFASDAEIRDIVGRPARNETVTSQSEPTLIEASAIHKKLLGTPIKRAQK